MTPRKRASLYARLSVAADAENLSLDGMISDMRALCEREGLEEVALHVDDGRSGGRRDRAEFEAWLNDARSGACDVLVNPVTDRLTREGLNVAALILDVVEGKDPASGRLVHPPVRLVDCNGLDSLHGDAFRFRFVIQAEVGRAERERIRDRSRAKDRRLRAAGRWPGGSAPYGYRVVGNQNGPGKVLEVDPEEAATIRAAAEAILKADPDPLGRVVRRLNHAGVKPRRAKLWTRKSLLKILTSDHVLGRLSRNGRPLRDADGQIMAPFPAVLTVGQVSALRAALSVKRPDARKGGRKPARLLSGVLSCHGCGGNMVVGATAKGVIYRCPSYAAGVSCPRPVTVSALAVEKYAADRFLSAAGHLPYYKERTVVSGLEELAAVEADIKDTLSDLATDATADTFARLQRLQARQKELSALEPTKRTELVATGFTMAEHWERSMVDDRRALLASALEELVLLPGVRGRRTFDHGRLVWRWADEPDGYEDEWLPGALETVRRMEADGVDVASFLAPE